jgi:hypothetical protein
MAGNTSSQSADWERTNTRARNAFNKQVKANPPIEVKTKNGMYREMPSKGAQDSINKAYELDKQSRNKITQLRLQAKKDALSAAAKPKPAPKPAPVKPNTNKYKSPGTNGFDGTQGFSKKGPWG